jgi:hypothetical protein
MMIPFSSLAKGFKELDKITEHETFACPFPSIDRNYNERKACDSFIMQNRLKCIHVYESVGRRVDLKNFHWVRPIPVFVKSCDFACEGLYM